MDTTNGQVKRFHPNFQAIRERHNDLFARYVSNIPMRQARDRQEVQQILRGCRAPAPTKAAKNKQYELHKQMKSSNDQSTVNTDLNGGFNNNDLLQVITFLYHRIIVLLDMSGKSHGLSNLLLPCIAV